MCAEWGGGGGEGRSIVSVLLIFSDSIILRPLGSDCIVKGIGGGGGGATRPLKEIKEMFIIISEVARSNSGCTFLLKETKLSINIIFKSGNKT